MFLLCFSPSEQYRALHYFFVASSFWGFIFFDLLYIAVVINYSSQCQLIIFYIENIKDKVQNKAYKSLNEACKVSVCLCLSVCVSVFDNFIWHTKHSAVCVYVSVCVHVHVCVSVSVCTCMYMCMCVSVYVHVCVCTCTYTCMCVSLSVTVCVCLCLCICMCVYSMYLSVSGYLY